MGLINKYSLTACMIITNDRSNGIEEYTLKQKSMHFRQQAEREHVLCVLPCASMRRDS